jgi:hypothetical protein
MVEFGFRAHNATDNANSHCSSQQLSATTARRLDAAIRLDRLDRLLIDSVID